MADLLKKKTFITVAAALVIVSAVLAFNSGKNSEQKDNVTDLNNGYSNASDGFSVSDNSGLGKEVLDLDENVADNRVTVPDKGDDSLTASGNDTLTVTDKNKNDSGKEGTSTENTGKDLNNSESGTDKEGGEDTKTDAKNTDAKGDNKDSNADENNKTGENSDDKDKDSKDNEDGKDTKQTSGISVESLVFNEETKIPWPVRGEIILPFSPDHAVYHSTLNQFKANPAVLIACEAGTPILAGVPGIVTAVYEDAWHGNMITIDVGEGYSFTYGQLDTIELEAGDILESGDLIGNVKEVTKYYANEGNHLYFQIKYEELSLDPEMFME